MGIFQLTDILCTRSFHGYHFVNELITCCLKMLSQLEMAAFFCSRSQALTFPSPASQSLLIGVSRQIFDIFCVLTSERSGWPSAAIFHNLYPVRPRGLILLSSLLIKSIKTQLQLCKRVSVSVSVLYVCDSAEKNKLLV